MLKKIVFTGIDNKTNILELLKLQHDFPQVEFGMLISASNTNTGKIARYPDMKILENIKGYDLHLAMHVCGKFARDIIHENEWEELKEFVGSNWECFQRIQLNVAGERAYSKEVCFPDDKETIIQFGKAFPEIYEWYKCNPNVAGFMDNSGGQGITETEWAKTSDKWFGYAGGISEENVLEVVKAINRINENDYWIDMESSIRANDEFDVSVCRRICEKLKVNGMI